MTDAISPRAFNLLCLTVLVVLAAHAPHLPPWITLPLAGLLGWRWWQFRRGGQVVPMWIKLPLIGLLLAAVLLTWGTPFGRAPGSALAAGLLALKLLESRRARDVRSAVAFACFVLMSALLFTQTLVATILVTAGLVPALACLNALQPHQTPPGWKATWLPQLKVMVWAIPLALVAFLFVPRLSTPLWGAPGADTAHTGLSRDMTPGNITNLLTDDRTAMRVEFTGPPPPNAARYFRGYVMTVFDGRGWHAGGFGRRAPEPVEALNTVRYSLDVEPNGQHIVPALGIVTSADASAHINGPRELYAKRQLDVPARFTLQAATRYRLGTTLDAATRRRALTLPPGGNPRSRALAMDWRARYGTDDAAIANAALNLIRDGGFRYTLTPAPLGRDSIDDFLFSTREGFCEHYSSSFAYLMRAAGIPARVVTGFQGGTWNTLGNYLQVRYSDAHAWDEVWLGARGWVRFDPTAAVRPDRISLGAVAIAGRDAEWYQADWLRALGGRWDLVNRWWTDAVIGFNALRQRGLLTPFGIPQAEAGQLVLALAIGGITLLLLTTVWMLRRPRDPDPLHRGQRELERWLARRGVVRRAGEGPRDYFERAATVLPARTGQLNDLAVRYLELRYARAAVTAADAADYRRRVREFRRGNAVT